MRTNYLIRIAVVAAAIGVLAVAGCARGDKPAPKRVLPLAFQGPSYYAAISGEKGNGGMMEPAADDVAVEKITWLRKGILPCFMQVYKRAPDDADRIGVDKYEQCAGAKGEQSQLKSVGEFNAPFAPTMRAISGIRACFPKKGKGRRLAALEVEITELLPDGKLSGPQTGSGVNFGSGYEDCGSLAAWSRCKPGEVATGVRAHFAKALGARMVVGVELRCRQLVITKAAR
jgi:hypothetical protein